jgi:hypothetical protein
VVASPPPEGAAVLGWAMAGPLPVVAAAVGAGADAWVVAGRFAQPARSTPKSSNDVIVT